MFGRKARRRLGLPAALSAPGLPQLVLPAVLFGQGLPQLAPTAALSAPGLPQLVLPATLFAQAPHYAPAHSAELPDDGHHGEFD